MIYKQFPWQHFIFMIVVVNHYHHHYHHYSHHQSSSALSSPSQWDWSLNLSSPHQHYYNHITTWSSSSFVVTIFNTSTPGGGGYSLCDGWYICAAVLTPFFHFGRIEHNLFGVFFSSTNSKAIFWGTKTTNFYKNRSFWPQIQFFLDLFGSNFQRPAAHPHQFSGRVPPPGSTHSSSITVHRVTITYWLAFTTYTKKHNDQNFHPSLSSKLYRHGQLLHEPHNVRWKATCAKYPNHWSNCWRKLVLNKAHLKKSWKYLVM